MKIYLLIVILFLLFGGSLFAGGSRETPASGEEKAQNIVKDEERRDKDWSSRISSEKREDRDARVTENAPARSQEQVPTESPVKEAGTGPVPAAAAGIGANFAPAGLSLGGSVSASINFGELGNEDSTVYSLISVRPQFGFFLVPKLSLTLTPAFYWKNILESGVPGNNVMYLGISAGVLYYFYSGGAVVPALGTAIGFRFFPEDENFFSYFSILVEPEFYTYFFVNSNFAPYISLQPNLGIYFYAEQSAVMLDVALSFGFAVFLPGTVNARY
ncbi:MAG: hypothetical protein E4H36_05385 [Spirochaetales bacterium]|nr:MAG: hypothetical protein E4H36_05385 [Spirochaetales bacterium]